MKMDMAPNPPILRSAMLAAGTGAPVLLLHGSASAGVMWVPVIDGLKSRFRVIAPELGQCCGGHYSITRGTRYRPASTCDAFR